MLKFPFDLFLNSFVVWINDKEAFRIIQSHHVIKHAIFKQSKGFLTACRNTAAYCNFLPFGPPNSGSKFRRYQVVVRYYRASAGMTKGSKLSKRKQNVLRCDDYFYFSSVFLSNMHYWPSVRWSVWLDIWQNFVVFFFRILLHFLKVLYFFRAWLCHESSSFARSLRDLTHWSSLRSLTFKNLWKVDL